MRNISLTDKLVAYFVLLSVSAVGIVGFLSYEESKSALFERTFDQLTSVRVVKKRQLENYIHDRENEINNFSELQAVKDIISVLNKSSINNKSKKITFTKSNLDYISFLKKYINTGRYYNKMIICSNDKDSGFILIDKFKSGNYKYATGNKLDTFAGNIKNEVKRFRNILIKEFKNDMDSMKQVIYIACPVYDNDKILIGVLILGIDTEIINTIMLETNPKDGLGKSGESYLVGSDYLMHSKSRFIEKSVLKTKVQTRGAYEVVSGKEGTAFYRDYRNIDVLGSYGKINIPDLNWFIIAEIDLYEANMPILTMGSSILIVTIMISSVVFIFTYAFSKKITIPIVNLTNASLKIADGNYEQQVNIKSTDEIGTLTTTFNFMTKELKRQKDEIQQERLKRSSAAIDAMENEHKRLSRELHDGLGQTLISLKLKLENIDFDKPDRSNDILREVKKSIDDIINEIRQISNNLMPSVLNEFGIVNAIRNLCQDLNEFSNLTIDFSYDFLPEKLDNRIQIYLFRITQEALNNVIQHSAATKAKVELKLAGEFIILEIADNGKGFNPDNITEGNGVYNIRERTGLINGECKFNSVIGKGTEIFVKVPVNKK